MWFLSLLFNIVFTDIRNTFITLFISFVVYKLSKFYLQVYSLPPGPLPLPLLGNILVFRSKEHWDQVIRKLGQRYGSIFTIWLGNTPLVFITDVDIGREAFRKNEFAGRQESYTKSLLPSGHHDVIATDYGQTWEALRKVTHSAAQKFSTNDKLIYLAIDCVDSTFKLMIEKEGINKGFKPMNYIYLLFLNILASSAFGKSYSVNDPKFKQLVYLFSDFYKEVGVRQGLWEFSSLLRLIDRKLVNKYRDLVQSMLTDIKIKFIDHYKDYSESIERDFCDALITAKNEALREGKESAPYLTDANLAMCVSDLFNGGTDTSHKTFQWILLFICYYPEIQNKLRQEIETQIGDKIPTHEDRNRCHYVMAFIMEILRYRNVLPSGIPHKAVVSSKIGDYTIPEGTGVFVYQGIVLTDEKYWSNSQEFRPERFLENGMFVTTRPKAFIPFSVGRRVCLGEKLAIADLFLVLVRFLQLSSDYVIVLGQNKGIEADNNIFLFYSPYEYEIIFKKK